MGHSSSGLMTHRRKDGILELCFYIAKCAQPSQLTITQPIHFPKEGIKLKRSLILLREWRCWLQMASQSHNYPNCLWMKSVLKKWAQQMYVWRQWSCDGPLQDLVPLEQVRGLSNIRLAWTEPYCPARKSTYSHFIKVEYSCGASGRIGPWIKAFLSAVTFKL